MPRNYVKRGQAGRPKAGSSAFYPAPGTPEPPVGELGWLMGWPVAMSEVVVVVGPGEVPTMPKEEEK